MKSDRSGFSLIELMVVVLIIAILAGIAIPIMRGKVDKAKWSEAVAAAGMIRNNVRLYYSETGIKLTGKLDNEDILTPLNLLESDLNGTYFQASDYEIVRVDDNGVAEIKITASRSDAPSGSITLSGDSTGQTGSDQSGSSQSDSSQTNSVQTDSNQSAASDQSSKGKGNHSSGRYRKHGQH